MTDGELFAAFATYQESRAFSPHTIRRRGACLRRFATFMAPASVLAAAEIDVDEFLSKLNSARTRHAYMSDLRVFYRWAVRRGFASSNPADGGGIRVPKSVPKPAPAEAIARAFTMGDGTTQLAVMLGALAGLRVSEIVSLTSTDLHLDAVPPVLVVRAGKGGKDRIVPIHPTLLPMLRGHSGWLFPSPHRRGHVRPSTMSNRLCAALSTGDQHITAHQLRHYFGTEAARWSGGNVVLVGSLMGHSDTATTMGYIGWSPTEGAEVVSKIVTGGVDDELTRRRAQRASA